MTPYTVVSPPMTKKELLCSAVHSGVCRDGRVVELGSVIPFDFVLVADAEDSNGSD